MIIFMDYVVTILFFVGIFSATYAVYQGRTMGVNARHANIIGTILFDGYLLLRLWGTL